MQDAGPAYRNQAFPLRAMKTLRLRTFLLLLIGFGVLSVGSVYAQTSLGPAPRDSQAIGFLTQSLTGAGGISNLTAARDFVGNGRIVWYWSDAEVEGTVSAKGRGITQFRLDCSSPQGNKSMVINNGSVSSLASDGSQKPLSNPSIASLTYIASPMVFLAAAFADPSYGVQYIGLEAKYGTQVHHIRLQKTFPTDRDPDGNMSKATRKDIFVSDSDRTVVALSDMIQPDERPWEQYQHEIVFSNYRRVSGILVPFSLSEFTAGQRTFSIEFSSVAINTGLTDSDFAS